MMRLNIYMNLNDDMDKTEFEIQKSVHRLK